MAQIEHPKLTTALKWGLGFVAAVVISPFVFMAVKGIVGLGIALAVGTAIIHFAPTVSAMLANQSMKLLRWDARKNPIDTRWNLYDANVKDVDAKEEEIRAFSSEVEKYANTVAQFAKENPEEAPRFQKHLQSMQTLRERRYAALTVLRAQLDAYKKETKKLSAIWDMSQASKNMDNKAGLISEKNAIMQIRELEANSSVASAMAQSFADLDHLLRTEVEPMAFNTPALSHQPADVIDMEPINQAQKVAR